MLGGHAVLAVGYRDRDRTLIFRNSGARHGAMPAMAKSRMPAWKAANFPMTSGASNPLAAQADRRGRDGGCPSMMLVFSGLVLLAVLLALSAFFQAQNGVLFAQSDADSADPPRTTSGPRD